MLLGHMGVKRSFYKYLKNINLRAHNLKYFYFEYFIWNFRFFLCISEVNWANSTYLGKLWTFEFPIILLTPHCIIILFPHQRWVTIFPTSCPIWETISYTIRHCIYDITYNTNIRSLIYKSRLLIPGQFWIIWGPVFSALIFFIYF